MIRLFIKFLLDIYRNRSLLFQLTVRDFKSRYLGSYLGLIWAFIQPLITILIFWFVFELGFKSAPVGNFPFILWLMTGIIPWFFISESLGSGTGSVVENSYLVKKIVFRVSMLPVIKILSGGSYLLCFSDFCGFFSLSYLSWYLLSAGDLLLFFNYSLVTRGYLAEFCIDGLS